MTMPSPNPHLGSDRLLHRLVDGDLSPEERAALLSVQGEARQALALKLEGLGEVRALVRAAAEAELEREALDADAMWAQISARVEGSRESLPPRTPPLARSQDRQGRRERGPQRPC